MEVRRPTLGRRSLGYSLIHLTKHLVKLPFTYPRSTFEQSSVQLLKLHSIAWSTLR